MNYKEIEEHFGSEEKLEKLLDYYTETFEKIEESKNLLFNGTVNTLYETDSLMKVLAGAYMELELVYTIAERISNYNEDKYFNELAYEKQNLGLTAQSTFLQKESGVKNYVYRRIYSIFKAYVDSCDRGISICQSSLKSYERERRI